jgi:hypothetical protein
MALRVIELTKEGAEALDWCNKHGAAVPGEFFDFLVIMQNGAEKHGKDSWMDVDNPSLQHKKTHDSLFHHLAESYTGLEADHDSGFHPLLHVMSRASMMYARHKGRIKTEGGKE